MIRPLAGWNILQTPETVSNSTARSHMFERASGGVHRNLSIAAASSPLKDIDCSGDRVPGLMRPSHFHLGENGAGIRESDKRRSEERRVGKECKTRVWSQHE